jgi:hypothetical protein
LDVHISETSVLSATKDQVSCVLDGEAVILNLSSGEYFGLDPVGARVWSLLQEPTSVKAILDILLEEYDVEPDDCERDLLALFREMAAQGLIEIKDDADS